MKAFSGLTVAPTEHFESLEQLRALWHVFQHLRHFLLSCSHFGLHIMPIHDLLRGFGFP